MRYIEGETDSEHLYFYCNDEEFQLHFKQAESSNEMKLMGEERVKDVIMSWRLFLLEKLKVSVFAILHRKMINAITGDSSLLSWKSRKNGRPWRWLGRPSELPAAWHPSGQLQPVSVPSLGPFPGPGTIVMTRKDSGTRWPWCSVCRLSCLLHELRPSSPEATEALVPTLGLRTGPFPTPLPVMSLWNLDTGHGGSVDTAEISKCCVFRDWWLFFFCQNHWYP